MSGIQPTGEVHLGNYLGAIKNWVNLSSDNYINNKNNKMILMLADLHSLTIPKNPKLLKKECYNMAASLLGCGINLDTTIIYFQSQVPQHSELFWLLSCHSPFGYLSRMPQYKKKKNMT
jgi:tryptophanyl-tRNA synthetase